MFPNALRLDLATGKHNLASDSFKCALYPGSIDPVNVTAYTTSGELSTPGYPAGGYALTTALSDDGTQAKWVVSDLTTTSFTATPTWALVYNNTAAGKNAVVALPLGTAQVTGGTLTIQFPNPLVRLRT